MLGIAFAAGCQASLLARHGVEDLAAGDVQQAMADFDAAAVEEPWAWVSPKAARAAADAWFLDARPGTLALLSAEDYSGAWARAWQLASAARSRPVSPELHALVEADLVTATEGMLGLYEAYLVPGTFEHAVHAMESVLAPLPRDHALQARLDAAYGRASAWHLALAEAAPDPAGQLVHLRAAQRYGADLGPRADAIDAAVHSPLALQVRVTAEGLDCPDVEKATRRRGDGSAGTVLDIVLTVDACERGSERVSWEYTGPRVFVTSRTSLDTEGRCPTGAAADCYVTTTQTITVSEETRFGTWTLRGRDGHLDIDGAADFRWDGGSAREPLAIHRKARWEAIQDPPWDGWASDVRDHVTALIETGKAAANSALIARHVAAAAERAARGDEAGAEGHYLLAFLLSGGTSEEANYWFGTRYRWSPEQVTAILERPKLLSQRDRSPAEQARLDLVTVAQPATAGLTLPAPHLASLTGWDVVAPPLASTTDAGASLLARRHVDLSLDARQSPLDPSVIATGVQGVVALARSGDSTPYLQIGLESPLLGGDAKGFDLELGNRFQLDRGYFALGWSFAEHRIPDEPAWIRLAPSVGFRVEATPFLDIGARFEWNLLRLLARDPSFETWSPLTIGVTVRPWRRVYLGVEGTRAFGARPFAVGSANVGVVF